MKKIYKYLLDVNNNVTTIMKVGAKILCVHEQHGDIYLWALIDADEALEDRHFIIYPTGGLQTDIPKSFTYIDTVHISNGLVWHVFERPNG